MTGYIDVHTHVVPESFPSSAGALAPDTWPEMACAQAGHRHVMVGGRVYRTVSHQCWDCDARRADMQRQGAERQVLSPMPELLSYWMPAADGLRMAQYLNDVIATMVTHDPLHFSGLGMVPLQDVDLAIQELRRVMEGGMLSGIELGTHINGRVIGDPSFFPFFEAAQALGASLFIHPLRPTGMDRLLGHPALEQVVAFPGETGLAAASLITGGLLARFPGLRIALSHGGGTLQALLPRLQYAWDKLGGLFDENAVNPAEAVRRMYYDALVYDTPTLQRLIDVFGLDAIMLGTDYPFPIMDQAPAARLEPLGLSTDARERILRGNARRWLGQHT